MNKSLCIPTKESVYKKYTFDVDIKNYDCSIVLTLEEQEALAKIQSSPYCWGSPKKEIVTSVKTALQRLLKPLHEALVSVPGSKQGKNFAEAALMFACSLEGSAFWDWDEKTWSRVLGCSQTDFCLLYGATLAKRGVRQYMAVAAYRLNCFTDFRFMGQCNKVLLAQKVFGHTSVNLAITTIKDVMANWGYSSHKSSFLRSVVSECLLLNRSPYLYDLSIEKIDLFRNGSPKCRHGFYLQIGKALAALGLTKDQLTRMENSDVVSKRIRNIQTHIDEEWLYWINKWYETSSYAISTRQSIRSCLYKTGAWLKSCHPNINRPQQWTRDLAFQWVTAVVHMKVGEYSINKKQLQRNNQPLLPRSKATYIVSMRLFFQDCQEWNWIKRHFDPRRAFATPSSIKGLIGPNPRIISDNIWAKLIWAGMTLTEDELFANQGTPYHSIFLVKALAIVWLFAGLRSDEIVRLRLGCIRWQRDDAWIESTNEISLDKTVCLLDVPVNKTGSAFTKPVDPLVGAAIMAWEKIRPRQPSFMDQKTGEIVDFLFCDRARVISRKYINSTLIPILCRKAEIPTKDVRGNITSHRARATIASQLASSRTPMSLFELQAWLGHRSATSTQSYVAVTPIKLAKAYTKAGYLDRNVRAIEVLIDRDALTLGVTEDKSWKYYDLGHCFCTYEFFEQCPHRMACIKCDFCVPKESNEAQLLESKANLLRFLLEIPLTDDERATVDGDIEALQRLITVLADRPRPTKKTPI